MFRGLWDRVGVPVTVLVVVLGAIAAVLGLVFMRAYVLRDTSVVPITTASGVTVVVYAETKPEIGEEVYTNDQYYKVTRVALVPCPIRGTYRLELEVASKPDAKTDPAGLK